MLLQFVKYLLINWHSEAIETLTKTLTMLSFPLSFSLLLSRASESRGMAWLLLGVEHRYDAPVYLTTHPLCRTVTFWPRGNMIRIWALSLSHKWLLAPLTASALTRYFWVSFMTNEAVDVILRGSTASFSVYAKKEKRKSTELSSKLSIGCHLSLQ